MEINTITEGNIGVILGLKSTVTGDTIINRHLDSHFHLLPIETPPPVFIASIEPDSLGEAQGVADALRRLLREDPSLTVTTDEDSGQILLGGMGELHLEISRDRLVKDFGAKCEMGNVRVSYRETIAEASGSLVERVYEREINGKFTKIGLTVEVSHLNGSIPARYSQRHRRQFWEFGNLIDIDLSRSHGVYDIEELQVFEALCSGTRPVLQNGSTFQFPLHSTVVHISNLLAYENLTTYQSMVSAARLATQEAFKIAFLGYESVLMEPFMRVLVTVDGKDVGRVVSDLSSARGGIIVSMDSRWSLDPLDVNYIYSPPDSTYREESMGFDHTLTTIVAKVPLKEMVGYSKILRSLTQGRGTFVMSLEGFEKMAAERASGIRKELTGLGL
jgi:elongation factor G